MEEPAMQQEKIEGSWEVAGHNGAGWKNESTLTSLLKHSCLLCWSSPRDNDVVETDERVLSKTAEIRELENAVAVENLELKEQQSDRKELEETLVKLEQHKDKLVQQIKSTRQLCYEESQQILSLQAEEVQKENQVEEYERELARARWRLRKLREEVRQAKRKLEEAGERNMPLQDSIKQSYEEILQEEHTLCSMSGGAVTPESQLDSTSPTDTTEDEPIPVRPWGRSQSLPAYADLIMGTSGSSFCNNLAHTRQKVDDSGSSSTKMERSDVEDDLEELDQNNEEMEKVILKKDTTQNSSPFSQLDFYQDDPFAHCQTDHDLFNEVLFPKTDSSDGFASDPFKGSDPFGQDILFPDTNVIADEEAANVADDADVSLSCGENKASTGTQCFESEFPGEDSDIELSYSREDLEAIAGVSEDTLGFKPIQSSSDELGPELIREWTSRGQYSVESDPNGYELDPNAVSPPEVEEYRLGPLTGEITMEEKAELEKGVTSGVVVSELDEQGLLDRDVISSQGVEWVNKTEPQVLADPQDTLDSQNTFIQPDSDQQLSFDLSYEAASQSSFDPYGFKLSPEHSSHTLLDPDEAQLSPDPSEQDLTFDPEPCSSSPPDQLNFDPYGFDMISSKMVHDFDPYGFKINPEQENQEVLDVCGHENKEIDFGSYPNEEQVEHPNHSNQKTQEPHENQEVLSPCSHNKLLEHCSHQDILDFSCPENQEVLQLGSNSNQELLDFSYVENQEVQVCDSHDNYKLLHLSSNEDEETPDIGGHENQEVLELVSTEVFPEANNNQCIQESNYSSDSDMTSEVSNCPSTMDLQGLELSNTSICTTETTNINAIDTLNTAVGIASANQDLTTSNNPVSHSLLEGDLGSVFRSGGYIGCPDVADDLEPLDRRQVNPVTEPVRPVRPVRPPRPSLRGKGKAQTQAQDIDLK
ncbi:uncharacterized protein LOC115437560 isoform X2 [Sphaeramia orbicularis]|uniref:uncharacterized protein LOC115437560 isoform X2 n=1 Tax=Sphaeramia orbicularis TaxID=375764 RepID=UPI00117CDC53|nr:uncharacterized protein LOC115437560 isoform X2 [Sphaeramia orbicularis]